MIDDQPSAGPNLIVQGSNRAFRRRRVLDHAQAEHDVVLSWREWQGKNIGLCYPMACCYGEGFSVGVNRRGEIHRGNERPVVKKNLGETSGSTPALEYMTPCNLDLTETALQAPAADWGSRKGVQLCQSISLPLLPKMLSIAVLRETRDSISQGNAVAVTFEMPEHSLVDGAEKCRPIG
jgi:hypothetical protein